MKINIIKTIATSFLISAIAVPVFVFAQVPATAGQDTGGATPNSTVPSTAGQNTGGATANSTVPSTAGQNTGGAKTSTPATAGQNTGGATAGTPSTAGQNTGGASAGATVTTPSSSTGGGSSYSSGSGSGSTLPILMNISQCNYLTSYLHIGAQNPADQVTRLQTLLKNTEGLNVDITGIFDQKTFDAVSAFQIKYTPDVLTPWGIKNSTGYVYYTTQKKINEIYCKVSFALTPAQIAEITAYRTSLQKNLNITPSTQEVGIKNKKDNTSPTSTTLVKDTKNANADNTQTATAAKTSFAQKIWTFIKHIFGR